MGAIIGYRYHSTAILEEPGDDGALLEDPRVPTGRPGSRAPHVALDWDGQLISTIDLFGFGFVLIAGPEGRAWMDAGRLVKERLRIQLTRVLVDEELMDVEGRWTERYGVGRGGAVTDPPRRLRRLALTVRRPGPRRPPSRRVLGRYSAAEPGDPGWLSQFLKETYPDIFAR